MRWRTEYNEQVLKELARLDKVDAKMILSSIQEFANHFSPEYEKSLMASGKIKKLKSKRNLYRLRLRVFRVIYCKENEQLKILVIRIGHRKDVYKNLCQ